MTANASQRAIKAIMRRCDPDRKLNILTFATHERYEENLCKTGHDFYSLPIGKTWDTDYAPVPDNYHIINTIPDYIDFDLILTHTSCDRMFQAHQHLAGSDVTQGNKAGIPILRHTHVLPDVRFDVPSQIAAFQQYPSDKDSFISAYNMNQWGMTNASVVEHGVDTGFWRDFPLGDGSKIRGQRANDVIADEFASIPRDMGQWGTADGSVVEHGVDTEFWGEGWGADNDSRELYCLSVVNEFPSRDWCCGFNLWREMASHTPCKVVGKCTGEHAGFSQPAQCREHLRDIYQTAAVFLNTSLHSPVPSVLLEAMACGCAIVSTANCMIPEIIQNGKNGLISNDPQELKGFLQLLLKDHDLAKELGNNARKTIVEKYNLERFVDSWNNLLYSTVNEYRNT